MNFNDFIDSIEGLKRDSERFKNRMDSFITRRDADPNVILQKLAALYNHPTTPKGEAEAAIARAKEISQKYGLSLSKNIYENRSEGVRSKRDDPKLAAIRKRELQQMSRGQLKDIVLAKGLIKNEKNIVNYVNSNLIDMIWRFEFSDNAREKSRV